jgi:hypothetical protein
VVPGIPEQACYRFSNFELVVLSAGIQSFMKALAYAAQSAVDSRARFTLQRRNPGMHDEQIGSLACGARKAAGVSAAIIKWVPGE